MPNWHDNLPDDAKVIFDLLPPLGSDMSRSPVDDQLAITMASGLVIEAGWRPNAGDNGQFLISVSERENEASKVVFRTQDVGAVIKRVLQLAKSYSRLRTWAQSSTLSAQWMEKRNRYCEVNRPNDFSVSDSVSLTVADVRIG